MQRETFRGPVSPDPAVVLERDPEAKGELHIPAGSLGTMEVTGEEPCMRLFYFLISCQLINEIGGREGANSLQGLNPSSWAGARMETKRRQVGEGGCHCELESFPLASITPLGFGSEPR